MKMEIWAINYSVKDLLSVEQVDCEKDLRVIFTTDFKGNSPLYRCILVLD